MCDQLAEGISIALEIVNKGGLEDTVEKFRQFCGPSDPVSCLRVIKTVLSNCFQVNGFIFIKILPY